MNLIYTYHVQGEILGFSSHAMFGMEDDDVFDKIIKLNKKIENDIDYDNLKLKIINEMGYRENSDVRIHCLTLI